MNSILSISGSPPRPRPRRAASSIASSADPASTPGRRAAARARAAASAPSSQLRTSPDMWSNQCRYRGRRAKPGRVSRARKVRRHRGRVLAPRSRRSRREARQHQVRHQKFLDLRRSTIETSSARSSSTWQTLPRLRAPRWGLGGRAAAARPDRGTAGHPSVRSTSELSTLSLDKPIPSRASELTRLVDVERQLAGADLCERPARPQTRDADRPVRARRGHQPRIGGQPLDRLGDRAQRSLAADRVQVVERDRGPTAIRDRPFISSSTAVSTVAARTARHDSARPPKPSPSRSTAVARCAHNRTGSSSANRA